MKAFWKALGVMFVLGSMATIARADTSTPEIDAGTAGSALTLLTGGLLILKDRLRTR